jgi:hypothetical protein
MTRYVAFGILRRDFIQLADDDDLEVVTDIAKSQVAQGLVPQAFIIECVDYFSNGIGPAHVPAPDREEQAPAPLNLSPHVGLSPDSFVGGRQSLHDVGSGPDPRLSPNQVSGRARTAAQIAAAPEGSEVVVKDDVAAIEGDPNTET